MATSRGELHSSGTGDVITAVSGLVLAAALLAVIGAWHLHARSVATPARGGNAIIAAPVTDSASTALAGPASEPVLFIVGSSEEQAFIWAFVLPLEQQQVRSGVQPRRTMVLVAPAGEGNPEVGLDLPPGTRIVDLRASAMITTTLDPLARELEALTAESASVPDRTTGGR